jgi:excisionase family DNA binding protein
MERETGAATLGVEEVAELLGVSVASVRKMVKAGKIHPLPLGIRKARFSNAEVDRVVSGRSYPDTRADQPLRAGSPFSPGDGRLRRTATSGPAPTQEENL